MMWMLHVIGLLLLFQCGISRGIECKRCGSLSSWEDCKNDFSSTQTCHAFSWGPEKCYKVDYRGTPVSLGSEFTYVATTCYSENNIGNFCTSTANFNAGMYVIDGCHIERCPNDDCDTDIGPVCSVCDLSLSMDDCKANQHQVTCDVGSKCATFYNDLGGNIQYYWKNCATAEVCSNGCEHSGDCEATCCEGSLCNTK